MQETKIQSIKYSSAFGKIVLTINISFVVLSILAIIKSIFISFDIDEGYAIAQSYRLINGDRFIQQMWEPHQLSGFFSAIFMLPFLAVTGGCTTGIIIYLRIIGTLIHLLIGFWLYSVAKKQFDSTISLIIALIHINFLPKWVSTPEFEVMHYWSVCILFLALYSWKCDQKKKRFLILSSLALFVAVMCYPTMLILYPVYLAAIFCLTNGNRRCKWVNIIWFTAPAFLLGVCLVGYFFSYMTYSELMENIGYILMDESHSNSLAYRCREYWNELTEFSIRLLLFLGITTILLVLVKKLLSMKGRECNYGLRQMLPFMLLLAIMLLSVNQLISSLLGDTNQFYLYCRYLIIVLLGISCSHFNKKENREYVLLGILPGIFSVIASAAITNMTLEIALARIYIAVIATCFIVGNNLKTNPRKNLLTNGATYICALLFLLSLLMCKLLLVRVTGCIPISVKMHMAPVTQGPAAGLLLKEELAQIYNQNTTSIQANITEEDNLLYFGCENIYYLIVNTNMATPSTQGTSIFNELYPEYYKKYPDKSPNVVIIDKTFETNPHYNYSEKNQIVLDWIAKEFKDATITETDYLIILRK